MLARERDERGLRDRVRAEAGPGLNALLLALKRRHPPRPCAFMTAAAARATCLCGEQVQLERTCAAVPAAACRGVPFGRVARVRTMGSSPPNVRTRARPPRSTSARSGHVRDEARDCDPAREPISAVAVLERACVAVDERRRAPELDEPRRGRA